MRIVYRLAAWVRSCFGAPERHWLADIEARLRESGCGVAVYCSPQITGQQLADHACDKCGRRFDLHVIERSADVPPGTMYALDVLALTALPVIFHGASFYD